MSRLCWAKLRPTCSNVGWQRTRGSYWGVVSEVPQNIKEVTRSEAVAGKRQRQIWVVRNMASAVGQIPWYVKGATGPIITNSRFQDLAHPAKSLPKTLCVWGQGHVQSSGPNLARPLGLSVPGFLETSMGGDGEAVRAHRTHRVCQGPSQTLPPCPIVQTSLTSNCQPMRVHAWGLSLAATPTLPTQKAGWRH